MAKLVLFKFIEGDFEQGFPVSLQIFNESDRKLLVDVDGKLPPMTDLPEHYQNWQSNFRKKVSGRHSGRMTVEGTSDTQVTAEISKAKQQLILSLNNWFKPEGKFIPIWIQLWQTLKDENEEVRVIFKTDNPVLQRLPFFLWNDFFVYYHRAEVSLYLPAQRLTKIDIPAKEKVKVLAIFGHEEIMEESSMGNTKIDLEKDWQLLTKLLSEESNAEVIRLKEPTIDELGDAIESQNPQILFFAGHSLSKANEAKGLIQLNKTQTITIEDLKFELIKAVKRGLQLAIFNSCDGIGIAKQLASLGVANIIVMREPVPDEVAQKFLQRFLEAFSAGKSLGLAVRRARERIHRFEREFPGATWLPMIWQQPYKSPLTWQELGGKEINRQSNKTTQKYGTKQNTQIPWLQTNVIKPDNQNNQTFLKNKIDDSEELKTLELLNSETNDPWLETNTNKSHESVANSQSSDSNNNKINDSQEQKQPSKFEFIGGRYQITKTLRETGFCDTFLAKDTQLPGHPFCVVKQLYPKSNEEFVLDTARRLFDNEAKVLYKLGNHPQIPRLLAHLEVDDQFYLVQEFIEGKDLSQEEISSNFKPWNELDLREFLLEVLSILTFVHQNNVIHRDIKPSNLIRQSDGKIVLIDFGAVKEITNITLTEGQINVKDVTVAIGTPGYMPIEQQNGVPNFNSDIYALGMTAIHAITGCHPDQLPRFETGEISWQDRANCSPEMAEIINKMVKISPYQRYRRTNEVIDDLRKLQEREQKKDKRGETIVTDYNPWKNMTNLLTNIFRK